MITCLHRNFMWVTRATGGVWLTHTFKLTSLRCLPRTLTATMWHWSTLVQLAALVQDNCLVWCSPGQPSNLILVFLQSSPLHWPSCRSLSRPSLKPFFRAFSIIYSAYQMFLPALSKPNSTPTHSWSLSFKFLLWKIYFLSYPSKTGFLDYFSLYKKFFMTFYC